MIAFQKRQIEFPEDRPEPFKPIDRNEFSENALFLLDRYRIDNANDPWRSSFRSLIRWAPISARSFRASRRRSRLPEWSSAASIWRSERPKKRKGESRP